MAGKTTVKIVKRPIGELKPDPKNVRTHTDRNIETIASSLRQFGQQKPIIVTEDGLIVAGNGTHAAAVMLEWTTLDCVVTHLKPAAARAYALADNRTAELAGWDFPDLTKELDSLKELGFDVESIGFSDDELIELLPTPTPEAGLCDPDDVPDAPKVPITKPGDVWTLGDHHRLVCGDATKDEDVALLCGDSSIDCVFTSPPYAVGLEYDTYEDTIANLRKMLPLLATSWMRILCSGGFAVVNFGDIVSAKGIAGTSGPCEYPMALEYWPVFRAAGFVLWSRRIWCKPGARTGSMQCISSNRASTNWEHVWSWKAPGKPIVGKQLGAPYPSQNGWFDTSRNKGPEVSKDIHSAVMPVTAATWSVAIHSNAMGCVYDPFIGSGTTLIACEQLGRKCYGIEISPAYCDVVVARWEAFTGKKAKRG